MTQFSIHFSPTGGTKKVADILCEVMGGQWQQVDLCRENEPMVLTAEDLCLVSVPSYGGRVPGINVERLRRITGNGAKAVLNCVYGNREWDDTLTELQDTLEAQGFVCVAAVAAVAEHSIFRQFAAGRPDEADKAQLTVFAEKICQKRDSGFFSKLELAGSHGTYKPFGGAAFKPEGSEKCTACGLCARECPVGAIDPENPRKTDTARCISCMRCLGLCPVHARDFDPARMEAGARAMAARLGGHKENYLFL